MRPTRVPAILTLGSALFVLLNPLLASPSVEVSALNVLTPHDPIFIDGNDAFTTENGATGGQGTPTDPYIIEGWDINASQRIGLVIQNTDAHVVVRNVRVHSGGLSQIGIRFYNVKNMHVDSVRSTGSREGIEASAVDIGLTIANSHFEGNGIGILLWRTSGIVVRDNTFVGDGIALIGNAPAHYSSHEISGNLVNGRRLLYYKNCADVDIDAVEVGQLIVANCSRVTISRLQVSDTDAAIFLAFTDHVVLRENMVTGKARISGTDEGISAHFVTNVTIEGNVIADNDYGLSFEGDNSIVVIRGNQFTGNTRGVFGWMSDFLIQDNVLVRNWKGLELVASSQGLIRGTVALDNEYGIDLGWAHDVTVTENEARRNGIGVSLLLAANVTVVYNNISSGRGYGVLASHSDNLTIAGNEVTDSSYGIYLAGTTSSRVYRNSLVRNEVQAWDTEGENVWDAGYPGGGNYWSDYAGADRCSGPGQDVCPDPDGIGDIPYRIGENARDGYPLMEPEPLPELETPLIAHNAPSVLAPGEAAAIDVYVASPTGVEGVFLHYGEGGQEDFQTVELTYLGNGHYRGWVTAPSHVGVLEYYIEVYEPGGNLTVSPATGKFQIMVKRPSTESLPLLVSGVLLAAGIAAAAGYVLLRRRRRRFPTDRRFED